jgi:hypothetical protein
MNMRPVVFVLAIAALASSFGTPHLLSAYACQTDGRGCIFYTRCLYVGVQGWRTFYPEVAPAEDCPAVKLFPLDWPPFTWRNN